MTIQQNISLQAYNSFGLNAVAKHFAAFKTEAELAELCLMKSVCWHNKMILGGGSNILFTKNFDGIVLKNEITGVEKIAETGDAVFIKCGAGVNWHFFVQHCISNNWGGLENLSLIPGTVGASPIQNIGAYGVEIKDSLHELQAYHLQENIWQTFTKNDCVLGYRDSVFKHELKGQFAISSVTFQLSKKHLLHTNYGAIEQQLKTMAIAEPTIKNISDAVIAIRNSKLPNPALIGNAGSFFKNPEVPAVIFERLQTKYATIVGYHLPNGNKKLAAGWLIEACGWKGYRNGDAGVHPKQALVLVNYGGASGGQILALAQKIIESVKEKFEVIIEMEVNVL